MITHRSKTITVSKTNNSTNHQTLTDKPAKNESKVGIFIILLLVSALIYAAMSR